MTIFQNRTVHIRWFESIRFLIRFTARDKGKKREDFVALSCKDSVVIENEPEESAVS